MWKCYANYDVLCKKNPKNNTAMSLDNYRSNMMKKIKVIIMGASDLTFQSVSFLICKIGYDTYPVELSKL